MNNFKAYPKYKDSGVEWLGEVPKHWKVAPGFSVVSERKEKNTGMARSKVLSLSYGKVIVKPEEKLTGLVPESFETYQFVDPGNIVIRPTDMQNDHTSLRTGLAKDQGIITSAYLNLEVSSKHCERFTHYFLHSIDTNKVIYGLGSGLRQNLDYRDFKRFPFLDIPKAEQIAIANFLDEKVSKIDEAIAQKEQLIQLLNERKQIIIQNAVTKGLNPNAPMRDSGIEWIGEIPEHWKIVQFRRVIQKIDQGDSPPLSNDDTEHHVLKLSAISAGRYISGEEKAIATKDFTDKFQLRKGDFLMTRGNTPELVADTCIVSEEIEHKVMFSDLVYRLIFKDTISPDFALHACQSAYMRAIIRLHARGSNSTMSKVSQDSIKSFSLVLPPIDEQLEIAENIEENSTMIMRGISKVESQIVRLKEYKATLINSAVTGKINVSNYGLEN